MNDKKINYFLILKQTYSNFYSISDNYNIVEQLYKFNNKVSAAINV